MRLCNLQCNKIFAGLLFLIHCTGALSNTTVAPVAEAENSVTIELSWQGEADVGLWLGAPSGEIIRSTHPVGESLPVWLEMAETMSADAVRQRLHLEYQLAEGQYQIAVQHLFSRSDIHYQVIMRQGNRLLRSARGYFARSAEWTVVVQRLWMLGADEAWNRALPLPLLREQFQGGWQLHTASGATVSVGIQEDTAELWIQEGSDCQQHIIKDAFTLPGAMRWQNGQLWLHPVFYNDLLYSVAQDREFLPLQQAPLESISCTPEHP